MNKRPERSEYESEAAYLAALDIYEAAQKHNAQATGGKPAVTKPTEPEDLTIDPVGTREPIETLPVATPTAPESTQADNPTSRPAKPQKPAQRPVKGWWEADIPDDQIAEDGGYIGNGGPEWGGQDDLALWDTWQGEIQNFLAEDQAAMKDLFLQGDEVAFNQVKRQARKNAYAPQGLGTHDMDGQPRAKAASQQPPAAPKAAPAADDDWLRDVLTVVPGLDDGLKAEILAAARSRTKGGRA